MTKGYSDRDLMKIAVEEHLKCIEFPKVGVVVAKNGKILATGFRGEIQRVHAERVALEKLQQSERLGCTLYTTLEPCVTMYDDQLVVSCADLIIDSGIREVVIGVLDANATIYSQGFAKLLQNNVIVRFFDRKIREAVELETFEYGDIHKVIGSGKRRVPVIASGIEIDVQFGPTDFRAIKIKWNTLQLGHRCVDLLGSNVTKAAGARDFSDITDPTVFRFASHYARMTKGEIAVVHPKGLDFCVLVKLLDLFEKDILFQWQVRKVP